MITFHIDSPDKLNSSSLASIPITSATLPRPAAKVAGKFRIEMKMDFFKAAHDSEVGAGLEALVRLLAGRLVILSIVLFSACLVPLAVRHAFGCPFAKRLNGRIAEGVAPEPLVGQLDLDFRQLERVLASLVASLNFISHCKSIPGQLGSLNYPSPGEEAAAPDGKNFHPDKFASIGVIRG